MSNCQSCGMPTDGKYCRYCQDKETGELVTYEQVRKGSIEAAIKNMGKTRAEAEKMADEMLPKLPRWKDKV